MGDADDFIARALLWRGVDDPCLKCGGAGNKAYSSTATWRGGIGGQSITTDICDACWGTGDRYRIGCDLRRLRAEEEKRVAERAVDLLAQSCGATFKTSRAEVFQIVEALDKFARKRGQHYMVEALAQGLANVLRRAIGAAEVRHV